jgi:hypothetical protein
VAPLVAVTDLRLSTHVPVKRLGRWRARGGGSCGLALPEPRIPTNVKVGPQKNLYCREHRRLLDRE